MPDYYQTYPITRENAQNLRMATALMPDFSYADQAQAYASLVNGPVYANAGGGTPIYSNVGSMIRNTDYIPGSTDSYTENPTMLFLTYAIVGYVDQGGPGPGNLNPATLLLHYMVGSASNYVLTPKTFNTFINAMQKAGALSDYKSKSKPTNVPGLYQFVVNTYGTYYQNAVGYATLYYNDTGFVGYSDWWNFDAKSDNSRSNGGESLTRFGSQLQGNPFWVIYGITPPLSTIPKH